MKKYIFMLLAAIAMFSSCTNDDIEKTYTKDEHYYQTFTYSISTQGTYDNFDLTSSIKSYMQKYNAAIATYTFLYDSNGKLAAQKNTVSDVLGVENLSFDKIEYGDYTAVTVTYVVDKDNNNESDAWTLIGTNDLTTLELKVKNDIVETGNLIYWYNAVGTAITKIKVDATTSAISVKTTAIGALVRLKEYNFNNSKDNIICFYTRNYPQGRLLNPAIEGESRFHFTAYNDSWPTRAYDYEKSGFEYEDEMDIYIIEDINDYVWFGTGCVPAGSDSYTSYLAKNTYQKYHFSDGETYYAGVFYIGGNTNYDVDGAFFEKKADLNNWVETEQQKWNSNGSKNVSLTTPYMTWGASVSAVQSAMKGYTMTEGNTGSAVYDSDYDFYYVDYDGKDYESLISYEFTSATTGLYESDVYYEASSVTCEELKEMLSKQYTYIGEASSVYGYMTSDGKTLILLYDFSDYGISVVSYEDASTLESKAELIPTANSKRLITTFNSLRKNSAKKSSLQTAVSKTVMLNHCVEQEKGQNRFIFK